MMTHKADTTNRILRRCHEMGFALAGVCDATPTEHERDVREWFAAGQHGQMGYLTRTLDLRLDPAKFVPGAKSIICVADRYGGDTTKRPNDEMPGGSSAFGRIARYARGKDYHRIMRDRLGKFCRAMVKEFPGNKFRSCVDTAPVFEREYAQRAGLGAIGKNTMLIERSIGSWLLLGEVITTLPLVQSTPAERNPCGECSRCIEACPTQAIASDGWRIDATRCISYLTIEHQSIIDERHHAAIGDWIFGCDICQEVCPHNQPKSQNAQAATHPAYAPRREGFDLLEVLNWSEADRTQASINSALKRARLDMLQRNAIIAMGNAALDAEVKSQTLTRLKELAATSESEMVRHAAVATLKRWA
jgi:epoxyqueuosine reductase